MKSMHLISIHIFAIRHTCVINDWCRATARLLVCFIRTFFSLIQKGSIALSRTTHGKQKKGAHVASAIFFYFHFFQYCFIVWRLVLFHTYFFFQNVFINVTATNCATNRSCSSCEFTCNDISTRRFMIASINNRK